MYAMLAFFCVLYLYLTLEVLNKILEKTNFSQYEVLLDDNSDTQSKIYLIKR